MTASGMNSAGDRGCPSAASIYDLLLAGRVHSLADRKEAFRILSIAPEFRQTCIANRRFMERAVRCLVRRGVTQFLDLGAGLPASPNVHEVALELNPTARVVYVDSDPLVTSRGRDLPANTAMIEADLRDPVAIMEDKELIRLLDLDQPIAIMLLFALNHVADNEDPAGIVAGFMEAVAPGSYMVLSHPTDDVDYGRCAAVSDGGTDGGAMGFCRSYMDIYRLFSGLYLVEPGLIRTSMWRPDEADVPQLGSVWAYGGVACK